MNHPAEGSRRDALTARRALALLALAACVTVLVPLALQGSAGQAYRRLSEELAARFGVSLTVRDVRFVFPREVVLWGVRLTRDGTAREPALQIDADELRIQPDLTSLLSGYTSLGRIVIRDARISLRLPEAEQVQAKALSPAPSASGAPAGTPKDRLAAVFSRLPHLPDLPFRVSLYRCSVEIDGLPIPGNAARVNGIDADLYQPPESADRFLRVSGDVSIGDETVPALVRARISGWQDAAVTLSLESVNVNRVAGLFPAKIPGWDPAGLVSLRAELEASRSNPLKAHIRADFSGILPPAPLSTLSDPISGTLDLDAAVEPDFGKLALHTALRSSILELFGDGTLDLNTNEPQIKATIRSEALPIEPLVKTGLAFAPPEAAGVSLTPAGPGRAAVFLSGPARNPGISVEAYLPGVSARYAYPDPKIPPVRVEFGQVLLRWTRGQKFPEGMISILDGGLEKPFQTINLDRVSATILLEKGQLRLKPFSARLNGEPIFGDLSADLETLKADVSAVLSVKDIEKTPLGHPSSDLWLSGEAILRATGQISPKRIDLKASAEATRAGIGLEWWLRKPIGVGASIHEARLILEPGKLLKVEGEASVDATPIKALLEYDWDSSQKKWAVNHIRVDLPHMDVNSAGKCFNLPYTITGTFAKDVFYERNRRGDRIGGNIMEIGGYIDQARLLPEGCPVPLVCEGASVKVVLDNRREDIAYGDVTIETKRADVPPLTETWMLPLNAKADPEYLASQTPGPPRLWTYHLSAAAIYMPPWQGEQFSATVKDTPERVVMEPFRAEVDSGKIEGVYSKVKETNEMRLNASWNHIPVTYLLRHLELPEVLEGRTDGNVEYTMDTDDPGTLSGQGAFTVKNGQFFSDALITYFGPAFFGTVSDLHPSELRFTEFRANVGLSGDRIRTSDIYLGLEGMTFTGSGTWITGGDIDYQITMSVQPDTAEQIPIMKQSFNIEGFRLAQRTIDLGFQIRGPAFKPVSEISGLPPVGVTLVSGAAEMTGETVRLFDLPRQLLFSLFKTGGGVIEATRQNLPQGPLRRKQNVDR